MEQTVRVYCNDFSFSHMPIRPVTSASKIEGNGDWEWAGSTCRLFNCYGEAGRSWINISCSCVNACYSIIFSHTSHKKTSSANSYIRIYAHYIIKNSIEYAFSFSIRLTGCDVCQLFVL